MRFNHLRHVPHPALRLMLAALPLLFITALMLVGLLGTGVAAAAHNNQPQVEHVVAENVPSAGSVGVSIVPEPSIMVLLGLGMGLLAAGRLSSSGK